MERGLKPPLTEQFTLNTSSTVRNVPRLKLSAAEVCNEGDSLAAELADAIAIQLCTYPHFLVLTGLPAIQDARLTKSIAERLVDKEPVKLGIPPEKRRKLCFTPVQIDAAALARAKRSTAYSRTNQPLALHTDSSQMNAPHELVAFQFVRVDADGGDTLMAPIENVLEFLNDEVRSALSQPHFPFGEHERHAVLWNQNGGSNIRYYRTQIDNAQKKETRISEAETFAIDSLDSVLNRESIQFRFRVQPGETVFMHNTKVLHGRTGFAAESDRLMYRIRAHVGCLN
jgi:hypothetical protein